jgi:hypothetical protein
MKTASEMVVEIQAVVDGLTKQIKALEAEYKEAFRRGDSRTTARCRTALSPLVQIRNRRRAELQAAKGRAAREQLGAL